MIGITVNTNSPQIGTTISTTLTPAGATATYQWFRGDTAIAGATSSSYTVTANDAGFILRVVATGTGNYTGSASHTLTNAVPTPAVGTPPTAPTNFTNTAQTPNSVTLVWNTQANLTGYTLQYRQATDTNWTTWIPAPLATASSATITGLAANTLYNFQLTARNTEGTASATVDVTTAPALPATPTNLEGANVIQDRLTLTWNPSDNATGYELWYRSTTSSAEPTRIDISGGQVASHPITDLLSSTTYTFQLRAVNTTGTSNWAYATITTHAALLQPPAMPANFAVKSGSVTSNTVTLTWSGQVGLTGYILQYKESTSGTWLDYNTNIPASATEIDISGLIAGTKYDFQLTARNADGTSIPAELRNIETIGLGTNYAVLFSGGHSPLGNYPRYYDAIKDLYTVLTVSYQLKPEDIYIIYADGTNPGVDRSDGRNSDMSFALANNVLPATYVNLDTAFATLGNKMTANDHMLFYTFNHGGGDFGATSRGGEETLTGWYTEIADWQVANSVARIQEGHVTMVFTQCFSSGILDNIIATTTGQKRISTNAKLYGMSATNHYELVLIVDHFPTSGNGDALLPFAGTHSTFFFSTSVPAEGYTIFAAEHNVRSFRYRLQAWHDAT